MENSSSLLVGLLVVLVLFIIGRELVCWYWKINKVVDLLERISSSLENKSHLKKED